jgi:hypothetical protein
LTQRVDPQSSRPSPPVASASGENSISNLVPDRRDITTAFAS